MLPQILRPLFRSQRLSGCLIICPSSGQLKGIVSDYQQEMTQKMIDEIMSDPNLIEKYAGNKRKLKRDIKRKQKKNPIDESIIQESYAKQYLKMVCNCI